MEVLLSCQLRRPQKDVQLRERSSRAQQPRSVGEEGLPQLPIYILLQQCPPHLQRELTTYGDVALDYSEALAELAECRAKHRALADAVRG